MTVKEWIPTEIRRLHQKSTCEKCGGTSRLGLHHRDRDRTNNAPENLLTLCPSCHTSEHWATDKTPWRRHSATCLVCGKRAKRLGLCETHRSRLLRHGHPCLTKKKNGRLWQLAVDRGGLSGPKWDELLRTFPLGWTDCEGSVTP
jgi:hypothetical protein